jgi:hypothetical protein
MWPFYKLLPHLPKPPEKFFKKVNIDLNNLPNTSSLHEVRIRFSTRNGKQFLASPGVRTLLDDEWENWVRENIVPTFNDTGVNWRHFNSDTGGVHTDTTRRYVLSYNIANGGPKCGVTWWQQDGQPLVRDPGVQHLSFNDVTPVCDLEGPFDTWFVMESHILHSAERIESPRVQFQVSLNEEHVPKEWLVN